MIVCFTVRPKKGYVFPDIKRICVGVDQIVDPLHLVGPDPENNPLAQLQLLAAILKLTASLTHRLPMREQLQSLTSQAVDVIAAELGDDVQIHRDKLGSERI